MLVSGTVFVIGHCVISQRLDKRLLHVSYFAWAIASSCGIYLAMLHVDPLAASPDGGLFVTLFVIGILLMRSFSMLVGFTILSVAIAFWLCRTSRAAKWLVLANVPALLFSGWIIVEIASEYFK